MWTGPTGRSTAGAPNDEKTAGDLSIVIKIIDLKSLSFPAGPQAGVGGCRLLWGRALRRIPSSFRRAARGVSDLGKEFVVFLALREQ